MDNKDWLAFLPPWRHLENTDYFKKKWTHTFLHISYPLKYIKDWLKDKHNMKLKIPECTFYQMDSKKQCRKRGNGKEWQMVRNTGKLSRCSYWLLDESCMLLYICRTAGKVSWDLWKMQRYCLGELGEEHGDISRDIYKKPQSSSWVKQKNFYQ